MGIRSAPLVVFNTTGWSRGGTVSIELDAKRLYFREGYSLEETSRRMKEIDLSGRVLVNAQDKLYLAPLRIWVFSSATICRTTVSASRICAVV